MDLGLEGKRALVLGSSDGLGHEIAVSLTREGAVVVLSGRDREKLDRAVATMGAHSGLSIDLTEDGEATRAVETATERLEGLDILVVNTGGGAPGGLVAQPLENADSGYRSMLRPALEAATAGVGPLRESGDGRLVFMTSRSILEATPELALSSVFRGGVAAAARSLAFELAPEVLVNVVVPGQFETGAYRRFESWLSKHDQVTPQEIRSRHLADIPLGRLGEASELGDVVTFLCSARASYVTGSVVRVDGGAVKGF